MLARTGEAIKPADIHADVVRLIGEVSMHSVHDYLLRRSKGRKQLFERRQRGYYRLVS